MFVATGVTHGCVGVAVVSAGSGKALVGKLHGELKVSDQVDRHDFIGHQFAYTKFCARDVALFRVVVRAACPLFAGNVALC